MTLDMTKIVEEIAMQAEENQEEFIFETIQPYCENILQMKINKEELKQILLKGTQKQQSCEDCISILNRIMEYTYGMLTTEKFGLQHLIKSMMDDLPSVTPSYNSVKSELKQPSEDCISREAMLRLVEQYPSIIGNRCVGLMADIKQLPSVTPSRPHGKWIKRTLENMTDPKQMHYCPNCGAKMEVKVNDES